jgi:RNA polymerase sigma-70 factor, ECF subfamily
MAQNGHRLDSSLAEFGELGALFEVHRPRLRAMLDRRIDRRLAPKIGAEDVLHEAYLVAQRRWADFQQEPRAPYPWLYGLTRDALLDAWRRLQRGVRNPDREMPWPERSSIELGLRLFGKLTSPSQALRREEIRDLVQEALNKLAPNDREVLMMRHFDDLSNGEIAEVLGISPVAVMQRYSRALRRIAQQLPQLGPEDCER